MPGAVSEDDHVVDDSNLEDVPTMEQNDEMELEMEESLAKEGLVTMSGVPNARWTSIPDWEEIKVRFHDFKQIRNEKIFQQQTYLEKNISRNIFKQFHILTNSNYFFRKEINQLNQSKNLKKHLSSCLLRLVSNFHSRICSN